VSIPPTLPASAALTDNRPLPANATEEFFVRRSPLYEVVGQLGMWGMLINGIQMAGLEHKSMKSMTWNAMTGTHPHNRCSCPCIHTALTPFPDA